MTAPTRHANPWTMPHGRLVLPAGAPREEWLAERRKGIGDRPVVTLKSQLNNPSVDPALEVDHPDIYAKYIRRGSSRRIHVRKGWETA